MDGYEFADMKLGRFVLTKKKTISLTSTKEGLTSIISRRSFSKR